MKQLDAQDIRNMKGKEKIACLTAYNAPVARALDAAGLPLLLVGDSVGTTELGYASTIPVTLDDMVRHTAAVVRGVTHALVLADMPFMSYQESPVQALRSAGRLLQETGCGAVKLEGGEFRAPTIRTLVQNGIPVCAHIGLTPQSHAQLGYRVQGRDDAAAAQLLADARAVEPVPFLIWHRGIVADNVQRYDEVSCVSGSYGLLRLQEFMQTLMRE